MSSTSKITKGVIWSTILNVINALYGFISIPILLNHFGKSEYGLIGLAMSINVYMRLMDMGFNSTNVRFYSTWLAQHNHNKVSKLFQTSLAFYGIIGLINGMIILGTSFFTIQIFHLTPEQDHILKNMFYILMFSAFVSWYSSCFDQVIRATENVAWIQKRSIIPKLILIVILIVTICGNMSIGWYFFFSTFAAFTILPMSINKIRRDLPFISFKPKVDKETLKEILPYCLNIFSFSIFQFSFYNLRPVFLGIQGDVDTVADYRILNGIIDIVSLFGSSFMSSLIPSAARAVALKNKDAYYRVAYDGTKYITILLCFCTFGMMTIGREVILLYVGIHYLYLLPWLNLWLICTLGVHNQAISSLILAGNDIRAISFSSSIASVVGLVVAWYLIPNYRIGGVIMAFCLYLLIQYLFYYFYYWPYKMQINSKKVFCESFAPYVVIGTFATIALSFVPFDLDATIPTLFIKGLLFSLIFLPCSYLLLTKKDREFFFNMIKRKKGNNYH